METEPRAMVHVRVIKDGDLFAAQCLEYDICAQGTDGVTALRAWCKIAQGQIALDIANRREPLAQIPCAPIPLWCDIKRDEIIGVYLEGISVKTTVQ